MAPWMDAGRVTQYTAFVGRFKNANLARAFMGENKTWQASVPISLQSNFGLYLAPVCGTSGYLHRTEKILQLLPLGGRCPATRILR